MLKKKNLTTILQEKFSLSILYIKAYRSIIYLQSLAGWKNIFRAAFSLSDTPFINIGKLNQTLDMLSPYGDGLNMPLADFPHVGMLSIYHWQTFPLRGCSQYTIGRLSPCRDGLNMPLADFPHVGMVSICRWQTFPLRGCSQCTAGRLSPYGDAFNSVSAVIFHMENVRTYIYKTEINKFIIYKK
jgi:hypothetical protein